MEAVLEEGPGVDARGGVTLDVYVISGKSVIFAAEEVVEANLIQGRRRGECGEMAADSVGRFVGLDHHDGRVPSNEPPDPFLEIHVAGEPGFLFGRDGVDVGGADRGGNTHVLFPGAGDQLGHEQLSPHLPLRGDDPVERVEPFLGFFRILVRELVNVTVDDHAESLLRGQESLPLLRVLASK